MSASKTLSEVARRLESLRRLLSREQISTQDELVDELRAQKFEATQSMVSRDLSRLGAVKMRDGSGRITYRLPAEPSAPLKGLLVNILHNGSMIVIQTSPGSASLVARQLDQAKPEGVLGTIAGDDTIFVAPSSVKQIPKIIAAIEAEFS